MKRILLILYILGLAGGGAYYWWKGQQRAENPELRLYGNVDLREVSLAFNNSERITSVNVQEGDRVHPGQVLATVEKSRLQPQLDQAIAQADAQRAVVDRLHHGSRPEEIAEDKANVQSAEADAKNARVQLQRVTKAGSGVVSQQDLDNARNTVTLAEAKLEVNKKVLELAVAGPRQEDIAQAEAQWRGDQAQVAYLRQQVEDTELKAMQKGIVRSRLLEVGDMASPQKPVFTIAITDPKWVRTYVQETDLGRIRFGMAAKVGVDAFPNHRFDGWIGFISPVAEFTPKAVQTTELRTSLVYEVRVFVKDPDDALHLGMPATVFIKPEGPVSHSSALAKSQEISPATPGVP